MVKKIVCFVFVFTFGLVLSACGAAVEGEQSASLVGTAWQLVSYEGTLTLPNTNPTIIFEENNTVAGSASCNSFSGAYQTSGQKIMFEGVMSTAMACVDPAGVMEQEAAYMRLLLEVDRYQIQEGQLVLLIKDQPVLRFAPAE